MMNTNLDDRFWTNSPERDQAHTASQERRVLDYKDREPEPHHTMTLKKRTTSEIITTQTEALYPQALLANALLGNLAIAGAVPDGETSSGHQKFRLMTPGEAASRAAEIAEMAWHAYRANGWILDLPEAEPPPAAKTI